MSENCDDPIEELNNALNPTKSDPFPVIYIGKNSAEPQQGLSNAFPQIDARPYVAAEPLS